MTKRALAMIMMILGLAGLQSANTVIFGDVYSKAGEAIMASVRAENENEGFYSWAPSDISPVIQIVEQGSGYAADPQTISFTVSFGFSEDDDPPVKLALGTFYMYAPLKTIIVELDTDNQETSLKETLKQIIKVGDKVSDEFLAIYEEGHYTSLEYQMQAELESYGAMVMQWFKTPLSQGGAGGDATGFTISDLAYFLGFDGGTYILNTDKAEYKVLDLNKSKAVIGAYPGEYREGDSPLYRATIMLATGKVSIIRRDNSGQ